MKHLVPFFILFLAYCADIRAQRVHGEFSSSVFTVASGTHASGHSKFGSRLLSGQQQHYKLRSLPFNTTAGLLYPADMYWIGSMTTQSYNHGKIGRFYLWDVQGNLRESKFFFDIAGKNKHGLKLVFSKLRLGL